MARDERPGPDDSTPLGWPDCCDFHRAHGHWKRLCGPLLAGEFPHVAARVELGRDVVIEDHSRRATVEDYARRMPIEETELVHGIRRRKRVRKG